MISVEKVVADYKTILCSLGSQSEIEDRLSARRKLVIDDISSNHPNFNERDFDEICNILTQIHAGISQNFDPPPDRIDKHKALIISIEADIKHYRQKPAAAQ